MKTRTAFIFLVIFSVLILAQASFADGMLYPIGPQQGQPSYPVPQYYPNGQQPYQYSYPPYQQPDPQPYYYPRPDPQPFQPAPPAPNYDYLPQQPFYDPYSQQYFYPIGGQDQYPYYPQYQPAPPRPQGQDSNVQISRQWSYNNTVNLTWTIRNVTNEKWDLKNVDILCVSGCHLLTNSGRTRWDIPYTVKRNGTLSFTVNIRPTYPGDSMTFSMVAGSKTLYSFSVNL